MYIKSNEFDLHEYIYEIVAKSSTIFERLNGDFIPEKVAENEDLIRERKEKWCERIAKGDWKLFEKRFNWDGIESGSIQDLLGEVKFDRKQKLPEWAILLEEVLDYILAPESDRQRYINSSEYKLKAKYPFQEILYPFVLIAKKRLIKRAGFIDNLLSQEVVSRLELHLLKELSLIASNALYLEFSIFLHKKLSSLDRLVLELKEQKSTKVYEEFISSLFKGKFCSFLEEYTVLARLLSTTTYLWIEANDEFIHRLSSDWLTIKQHFFNDRQLGLVVDLQLALSDYHNGRRSVAILQFSSGDKLVYKPKDLGIDCAYFKFLEWLSQEGMPLPFKSFKVLKRKGYGWAEHIKNLPCEDADAARRFYIRAGMLLCLMYLLEGVDCFYENIIASGEYPVLVDMETLMHNNFKLEREYSESYHIRPIDLIWWNSVFRIGLLPTWRSSADRKQAYDIGGLREAGKSILPFFRPVWSHINSDIMKCDNRQVVINVESSVPKLNGIYLKATDYVNEIVTGFEQMYLFLLAKKSKLLAPHSPLYIMAQQKVRYILRNTKFYNSILQTLLEPEYLRCGIDRSIEIDIVSRLSLDTGKKAIHWSLAKFETTALEKTDIPFFSMKANSTSLDLPDGKILENFCENTSIDNIVNRLNSFSKQDLKTQTRLTQNILYLSPISGKHSTSFAQKTHNYEFNNNSLLSPKELIAEAVAIAQELQELAIYSHDNSATWIAPQLQGEKYILQPVKLDIYGGTAGIVFFLAALEKVTGGAGYKKLIQKALKPIREVTNIPVRTLSKNGYTIGGLAGIGSLVYFFTNISELLDEPSLLVDAKKVASLITKSWITCDKNLDVVNGSAGAILALLTLYKKTNDAEILEKALCCGEHLLRTRMISKKGFRGWHLIGTTDFITGFSHGTTGIAYALLRLYEETGKDSFLEAARESISYEQSIFDELAGNWPDYRQAMQINGCDEFMTAWCHGAPGIALARMGALSVLNTVEIKKEVLAALKTTGEFSLRGKDHLCCGNFGRIEILQVASQIFSRQDLSDLAVKKASWVVCRAKRRNSYHLFDKLLEGLFNPSFFQGTSGIGYQLLRLVRPNLLPSVLLLK